MCTPPFPSLTPISVPPSCCTSPSLPSDELESELALHQGFQGAGLLLDLRRFYDSVNLADLVDAAIELNYPLRLLALALDSYLGVRILTLSGCIHKGILPSGGILPGCGQAVSLARAFLFAPFEATSKSVSGQSLREWVDDISCRLYGTHASLVATFPILLRALLTGLRRRKVQLSPDKSGVLASSASLRRELVALARQQGCDEIKGLATARDLGHDTSLGARRTVVVRRARMHAGSKASAKINRLSSSNRDACKLFRTNAYPKSCWASEVHGLAPRMIKRLRAMAHASSRSPQKGTCCTTALRLTYGPGCDPA